MANTRSQAQASSSEEVPTTTEEVPKTKPRKISKHSKQPQAAGDQVQPELPTTEQEQPKKKKSSKRKVPSDGTVAPRAKRNTPTDQEKTNTNLLVLKQVTEGYKNQSSSSSSSDPGASGYVNSGDMYNANIKTLFKGTAKLLKLVPDNKEAQNALIATYNRQADIQGGQFTVCNNQEVDARKAVVDMYQTTAPLVRSESAKVGHNVSFGNFVNGYASNCVGVGSGKTAISLVQVAQRGSRDRPIKCDEEGSETEDEAEALEDKRPHTTDRFEDVTDKE